MLKEQVLSVVGGTCHYLNQPNCPIEGNNACELCDKQVEYIINLFKAEVDKLTELTDSEVSVILEKGFDMRVKPTSQEHIQRMIQFWSTKKQLLGLMGE